MSQNRQLAAIMFTDIVCYTSLMGNDEQKAFDLLKKNRQIQKPVIEGYSGKFIKELGDGILASFNTASDAVNAAVAIIKNCKKENSFQLRIGIHLGEVIFENEDVFGDGVNIASRIQSIASPNHIFISETVHDNVINKKNNTTRFVGEERLKNVKEPVKIYDVITDDAAAISSTGKKDMPSNSVVKSIAVLPFLNMSNDAEQDYFCDGISEEILTALTQLNNLRVISRTSSFALKNKNLDAREIGKILNVQSLLEGSVRKAGNRVRITTKLINVSNGTHVWSERYDRELDDIFAIQENIAINVATALKGYLTSEEREVIRRPETVVEAYEYYLKGRRFFHKIALEDAQKMYTQAIELDAEYALAYAGLSDVHSWTYEWLGTKKINLEAAEKNSVQALSLAPNLSESHSSRGYVLSLGKKYAEADHEFNEAIHLNSNSFDAYYLFGRSLFARGDIEKSAEMFRKASDARQEDYQSTLLLSQSLRFLGKIQDANEMVKEGVKRAKKQLALNPTDSRTMSLLPGFLLETGDKAEAFQLMNKALDIYPEDASTLLNGVCFFAKNNDKERALHLFELAVNKGIGNKDWIEHDTDYDSIRGEPRFKALMEKLH